MLAPKRSSRPSSGKAQLDAKFYEAVLKDFFSHYDILGDCRVLPEAFTSTQHIIKCAVTSLGLPSKSDALRIEGISSGRVPGAHRVDIGGDASRRCSSHSRILSQHQSNASSLSIVGSEVISTHRRPVRSRIPSPPARLAKVTLGFSADRTPARSPSLTAYCRTRTDIPVTDFESFLQWQHGLLAASARSSSEKLERLLWFVREVGQADVSCGRSQFWRARQAALELLHKDVEVACQLEAQGDIVSSVQKLGSALLQIQGIVTEEGSRKREGNFAIEAQEKHQQHITALKQKYMMDLEAELQNDLISCRAFEAKLEEAATILSKAELAPQFERLEYMRKPFEVNAITLAGSEVCVQASRTNTVAEFKELLAAKLDVQSYRISLSNEGGELLLDAMALEDQGICDASVQVFLILRERDKFREMLHEDFLSLIQAKRLYPFYGSCPHTRTEGFDDLAFRQPYIQKLEALEKAERQQQERKEQLKNRQEAVRVQLDELIERLGRVDAVASITHKIAHAETETQRLANEASAIKADAERDLDTVLPALHEANDRLDRLRLCDICEVRSYAKPPPLAEVVGEAVCVMFGEKPSWFNAKKLMSNPRFLDMMKDYDKDGINPAIIERVERYIERDDFMYDLVVRQSTAAAAFCSWIRAMHTYDRVSKILEPKRQMLFMKEGNLEEAMLVLRIYRECLARLENQR